MVSVRNSRLNKGWAIDKCDPCRVIEFRGTHMNGLSLVGRAAAFAVMVNLTPAAAQPMAAGDDAARAVAPSAYAIPQTADMSSPFMTGTPHWEWTYRYAGRHARYEGQWVLVR